MTNGGITEGQRSFLFCCSDLSPATYFPNGSMRVFHGAGTTDEENKAGRWTNIPEQSLLLLSKQCRNSGGSGVTLRAVSLRKPAIEKEARLRPQHFNFVVCSTQSRRRVVQRKSKPLWPRATSTFGSGDRSFADASEGFKGWGG
jgi:hypothetical protein